MEMQEYLAEMSMIYNNILDFIDSDKDQEQKYKYLASFFDDTQIHNNQFELIEILNTILQIANEHQRSPNFFNKIEKILLLFKEDIKNHFTNFAIFRFFQTNNRILLFLINERILIIDDSVSNAMKGEWHLKNYQMIRFQDDSNIVNKPFELYFSPELNPTDNFIFNNKYNKDEFDQLRKNGENDQYICQLIRNDSIKEFIQHVNSSNIDLTSTIKRSIFETNFPLNLDNPTLIQYAAYYGSAKIFQYLLNKDVEIDIDIVFFAIHGRNQKIIHLIEEYDEIDKDYVFFKFYLLESYVSHNNEYIDYLYNNFSLPPDMYTDDYCRDCLSFICFNFSRFPEKDLFSLYPNELFDIELPFLFQVYVKSKNVDINGLIDDVLLLLFLIILIYIMHQKWEIMELLKFYWNILKLM